MQSFAPWRSDHNIVYQMVFSIESDSSLDAAIDHNAGILDGFFCLYQPVSNLFCGSFFHSASVYSFEFRKCVPRQEKKFG